jgi:hypothetical protein
MDESRTETKSLAVQERDHLLDVAMVGRPPLQGVLDRLREVLGVPVAVQTPGLLLLQGSGPVGDISLDPDGSLEDRRAASRAAAAGGVVAVPAQTGRPARAVVAVRAESEVLGYLVAGCPDSEWVRDVLSRGASLVALVLLAGEDAQSDVVQRRAGLFHDLLAGVGVHGLIARAAALGYDLRAPHRPIALGFDDPGLDAERLVAALRRLEQLVVEQGSRVGPWGRRCLAGIEGRRVIAFVPDRAGTPQQAVAERIIEIYRTCGASVSAGIGSVCSVPTDYALGARQALRALDVLELNGRREAVLSHDDLGVYGLLFSTDDATRLHDFVGTWIGRLLEHDAAHPGELTRTLECILDRRTLVEAGEALSVHMSTLKYRLRRVEAILGVDLRNAEVPFNLHLALKVHRILTQLLPRDGA